MDHLCYPSGTHIRHLHIPFFDDDQAEYDGGPFGTYAIRRGWSDDFGGLQWLQCSKEELARRVQAWLYFGLLSSFCGHVIPRNIFRDIEGANGTPRLSTARLPQLLDTSKRDIWGRHLNETRCLLKEALQLSDAVESRVSSGQDLLSLVSCSVRVLIQTLNSAQGLHVETLSSIRRYQAGRRWPLKFSAGIMEGWRISVPKAIEDRMASLGWCPFQIADLRQKYSCNVMYYVSSLPTRSAISHTRCENLKCIAYNIDESTYVPCHDDSCSRTECTLIDVMPDTVASIIEHDNGIPLLACSSFNGGQIRLEIVRAQPGMRYLAISHVWSGGLGNPSCNGLPKCEVQELISRMESLRRVTSRRLSIGAHCRPGGPLLFWMDTFCVPVGQSFRRARKMAINLMAEIFSGADAVLVMDPELQRLTYSDMEPEQSLAHVVRSSWMSRCWTLLEASLSNSWHVQFKDRPIDMARVMERCRTRSKVGFLTGRGKLQPSMKRAFGEEISNFLFEMGEVRYQRRGRYDRAEIWNLKQLEAHQAYVFATTWNNFLGRTTSKLEDLHQILAALEDMRVANIRELSIDDRMKAILKCHASLPIDLLFCCCDRMCDGEAVNAWAPKLPEGQRLDDSFGTMKLFTDCLYISKEEAIEHLQLYFISVEVPIKSRFQIEIPDQGKFWIEMHLPESSRTLDHGDGICCLVLPTRRRASEIHRSLEGRGARFLLREKAGEDLHLRYDGSFRVYVFDQEMRGNPSMERCVLSAEPLKTSSRIFIDCGK